MKRNYKIWQIDAFTKVPFKGNPAAVTFSMDLSETEMKMIANEMNLSETAFIGSSDKADYKLRWFTPTVEVDLCGHATIASIHYLNELGKINNRPFITFETRSGILKCPVNNDEYLMQIPKTELKEFNGPEGEIVNALGFSYSYKKEYPFIILGNGYIYIYVKELEALKTMKPDFRKMKELSVKHNIQSFDVFTLETFDKENFAHSRFFTPYDGINEDPVTGSANGPLMLVLRKLELLDSTENVITKTFEQGDIIGRTGRVKVTYTADKDELYIGGNAVTVVRGELYI